MSQDTTTTDSSGYRVRFERSLIGWRWHATAPDGSEVPGPSTELIRCYLDRGNAEAAALKAIERHAAPELIIDGEALRRRVEERDA